MEIAFIVTAGIVLVTIVSAGFDYLGKRKKSAGARAEAQIKDLEQRLSVIETELAEKDDRLHRLERDLSFVNKLLEDKTK